MLFKKLDIVGIIGKTAVLDMLEADATYLLTEAERGTTQHFTGAELAKGLPVILEPRSGVIYFIDRT